MAAPSLVKWSQFPSGNLPGHSYVFDVGFARTKIIDLSLFQFTASGSGTNEYYIEALGGGDPTSLFTSNSILNPVFRYERGGSPSNNNHMFCVRGTAGTLAVDEFDYADNDALGFNTFYFRLNSGTTPPDLTSAVEWDESTTGDSSDLQDCTIEWRVTSYPVGWSDLASTYFDFKWQETVDLKTETWTSIKTSRIQGTSLSFVCDQAGAYGLEARVTNGSGDQTTTSWSWTVAAETRTSVLVDSGGGGDYTTLSAAITAGEDYILIDDSHTETYATTNGITFAHSTPVRIEWNRVGTRPTFYKTTTLGVFFQSNSRDDLTISGVDFVATGTSNVGSSAMRWRGCHNVAIMDCRIRAGAAPLTDRIGFFCKVDVNTADDRGNDGVLFWGCGSTTDIYEDYWLSPDNSPCSEDHVHVIGCEIPGSPTEQALRFNKLFSNILVLGCYVGEDGNDSIRVGDCNAASIHSCRLEGTIDCGAFVERPIWVYRLRVSGCLGIRDIGTTAPLGQIVATDNCHDTTFVNCICEMEGDRRAAGSGATDPGALPTSGSNPYEGYGGMSNIKVVCCTGIMWVGTTSAFGGASGTYVTDSSIVGCLIHTPAGSTWTGAAVTANAFTTANNSAAADWELDADDFSPTVGTFAKPNQAYDDFWGNIRSSTTRIGATEFGREGPDLGTPFASLESTNSVVVHNVSKRRRRKNPLVSR